MIPIYQIFGSELLSSHSKYIQKRIPVACILLNKKDGEALSLEENDIVTVHISDSYQINLPVHFDHDIVAGVAGYLIGLTDLPFINMEKPVKISRGKHE